MKSYLGVDVPDDARGVLQDIHWSTFCPVYSPLFHPVLLLFVCFCSDAILTAMQAEVPLDIFRATRTTLLFLLIY